MGLLDLFSPRPRAKRTGGYRLWDNIVGIDDDTETPGERFAKGANKVGKKILSDPSGLLGSMASGIKADLDNLMFEGGAMQRPEAVMGYAAAPMAPGAAGLMKNTPNVTNAIKAYHGSPHSFDKFSMDKIGTGEGAQAYGHGLYFAENEGVARGYKDALKMKGYDNGPIYNDAVNNHGFGAKEFDQFESIARQTIHDPDVLARAFFDWNDEWRPLASDPAEFKNVRDFAEKYIKSAPQGSMYEVNINANPADFLDWDAPLSAQSPKVRGAFDGVGDDGMSGQGAYEELSWQDTGGSFSEADAGASRRLREAGIPGIKYRDAGSRGMDGDSGTRNYVVFDENLISIVRKYGVAGAAAMLGVSAADIEGAMNGS